MSVPLEQQSFWTALVADARRKPLRQVARDYGTTLPELQAALLRADVLGVRPSETTTAPASAAPLASSMEKVGAPTDTTRRAGRFPRRADSASGARARIEQVVALLGTEPDGAVARRAGVARKTIVEYRKANGIPAYKGDAAAAGTPNAQRIQQAPAERAADGAAPTTAPLRGSRLDAFADIIGVLPDREVAERAGVSAENVRMYRARRGIAAGWRHAERPMPTLAAAAPEPSPRAQPAATFAWRVHVMRHDQERRVYSVVADDLLAAVTHAERALGADGWSIEGICRIGEVLRP